MKNRLRYLARIRRMRLAKVRLNRAIIPLLIVILLSPLFTVLIPLKTNAAGTNGAEFTYIDNLSTGAKAVGIMAATTDGPQRYHRVSGSTQGSYNGGGAKGYDGCVAVIQTDSRRYDGSSNATWWASCNDGVRDKTPITIAPFKNIVGKWIDHSRIQVGGTVYYDGHTDNNNSYSATNQNNSCDTNIINNFPHSGGDARNATEYGRTKITIHKPVSSANSNCLTGEYPIAFDDVNNYAKYFSWVDSGTIQTSDGTAMTFVEGDDKGHYLDDGSGRSSDSKCKSGITADPNDPGHGVLVLRNSDGNPFPTGFSPQISGADMRDSGGCKVSQRLTVNIAGTVNAKKAPGTGNAGSGSGSGSDDGGVECSVGFDLGDLASSLNPLNWLMCGIVLGLSEFVQGLDDQINKMLAIDTDQVFGNDGYEKAWSKFRNIALGLLVIVSLIVVIAQALGMEIVDAYTIRKMLPRILIATVAIVLSWQLMKFAVNITNDLGWGIDKLISTSFSGAPTAFNNGNVNSLLVGLAAALGLAVVGLFGLMSFIGTAAIAVIITFLVLILRQVAIIMMMVFSPIAIIAYVLPNTQRLYKFWWESFSKMLLMFPMIIGFIAIAHVFSSIATTQSGSIVNQIIAFIAYFGPYFAIPLTFRFAGSIMGAVGNAVNSRGEGARGFLRNFRSGRAKQNLAEMKTGTRFEGKRWIPGSIAASKGINKATMGLGTGWKGRYGFGKRGAEARGQVISAAKGDLLRTPGMQAIKGKNDFNRILAEGMGDERRGRQGLINHLMAGGDDGKFGEGMTDEGKLEAANQRADVAAKAAKAAGGFTMAHGAAAMYNMAQDGTAIRDTDDLARLAALGGQGNGNNTFTFAAEMAGMSRQAGRSDLAAASEPIGELAFAHSDRMFKGGLLNKDSNVADDKMAQLRYAAWASGSGGEVAYSKFSTAKGRTVRNDTRSAVDILKSHRAAVESGKKSPYKASEVQFAAATLVDGKNAIEANYGRLNNRIDAAKEMNKDGGALDWYLDTKTTVADTEHVASRVADGTPIYAPVERTTTNREAVKKIVGDRYASMSTEQREEMMRRGSGGGGAPGEEEG